MKLSEKWLICIFSIIIGAIFGYLVKDLFGNIQSDVRWVRLKNETSCEIISASVVMKDRITSVSKTQMPYTLNYYNNKYDISIPVLVSSRGNEYQIRLDFSNCPSRTGELRHFSAGTFENISVTNEKIFYEAR